MNYTYRYHLRLYIYTFVLIVFGLKAKKKVAVFSLSTPLSVKLLLVTIFETKKKVFVSLMVSKKNFTESVGIIGVLHCIFGGISGDCRALIWKIISW